MSEDDGKVREILEAAARAFARYGFRKTTMGDVVREAGVARGTVYKHFSDKEELFQAVLGSEAAEVLSAVEAAVAEKETTREKVEAAMLTHLAMVRRKINLLRVTVEAIGDIMSRWHDRHEENTKRAVVLYARIFREGMERGEIVATDPETTALLTLFAFKGLFISVVTDYLTEDVEGYIDRMVGLIFDGLTPRGEAT